MQGTPGTTIFTPAVTISEGLVHGRSVGGIHTFHGIPYAAPPIRELRFRKPRRPASWDGIRPALVAGSASLQPRFPGPGAQRTGVFEATDEDCLYLNLWTPELGDARLPVVLWLHGGGHIGGSGALAAYDGTRLARHGAVVITCNYRLGALGFLHLDELFPGLSGTGNLGFYDHLRLLEWISENVAAFGGDPDNVMVMGSSAGGLSTATLLSSPAAAGSFRRAGIFSASTRYTTFDSAAATAVAREFLQHAGIRPGDTGGLMAAAPERLVIPPDLLFGSLTDVAQAYPLGPVIDGDLIDRSVLESVADGRGERVDLLIGNTTEEERAYQLDEQGRARSEHVNFERATARFRFPVEAREFYSGVVRRSGRQVSELERVIAARTDAEWLAPSVRVAEARVGRAARTASGRTFAYRFAWSPPAFGGLVGATHGLSSPFFLGNVDTPGWRDWLGDPPTAEVAVLAEQMRGSILHMAGVGDPNHSGLPHWPRYDDQRATMMFDEHSRVVQDPEGDRRRFVTES